MLWLMANLGWFCHGPWTTLDGRMCLWTWMPGRNMIHDVRDSDGLWLKAGHSIFTEG